MVYGKHIAIELKSFGPPEPKSGPPKAWHLRVHCVHSRGVNQVIRFVEGNGLHRKQCRIVNIFF